MLHGIMLYLTLCAQVKQVSYQQTKKNEKFFCNIWHIAVLGKGKVQKNGFGESTKSLNYKNIKEC